MKSILFKNTGNNPDTGLKAINNIDLDGLAFDETFSYYIPDDKKRKNFFSIVLTPVNSADDILYRQNLIRAFSKSPGFISDVESFCNRLEIIKEDFYETKRRNASSTDELIKNAPVRAALNKIGISAFTMKRISLAIKSLRSQISKYDRSLEGIHEIADRIDIICSYIGNEAFVSALDRIMNTEPDADSLEFYLSIDCFGVCLAQFVNVNQSNKTAKSRKKHPELFGNGQFVASYELNKILANTILSVEQDINQLATLVFNEFKTLSKEILFYSAAMEYTEKLTVLNISFDFPQYSDGIDIIGLYDLLLLSKAKSGTEVVSNSIRLKKGEGCLIYGDNGSGKTVFLRSICSALLIANSGLPIPAKSAKLYFSPMIFVAFAVPESGNTSEKQIGRFESEVQVLSKIIGNVTEGGIVFLNELFQSTRFSEGAEALNNILDWFTKNNVNWIAVTHIKALISKNKCKKICMCHFGAQEIDDG